jgi:hypothetical protein
LREETEAEDDMEEACRRLGVLLRPPFCAVRTPDGSSATSGVLTGLSLGPADTDLTLSFWTGVSMEDDEDEDIVGFCDLLEEFIFLLGSTLAGVLDGVWLRVLRREP